ncbi:unnamed protein product [Ophioblennius macclurei]
MSEVRETQSEQKAGRHEDPGGLITAPMQPLDGEASSLNLDGLLPASHPSSTDVSPSPSETSGLLSLPWEIIANIASHLPAQCVLNVLPKVCHALANVAKDSTAWQLRARKIIGSRGFPVGPKEDFNWPAACIELEQLLSHWTVDVHHVKRRICYPEEERRPDVPQQQAGQNVEPAAERQRDALEDELQVAEVAALQIDHGENDVVNEGGDEMQPMIAGAQEVQLRELEERQRNDAEAPREEETNHRMVPVARQGLDADVNVQDGFVDPINEPNGGHAVLMQQEPSRSQNPPPTLEYMSLSTSHIAQINSVLLLGGEGRVCATASRDWNVKLWDLEAASGGTLLHTLVGKGGFSAHQGWVWCLDSQGPLLASGGFDNTVRLWDLQAGGAERGVMKGNCAVLCLSYQTDVLLTGSLDNKVTLYDPRAGNALIKVLELHGSPVMSMVADDKYVISGGKAHTVVIYDRRADKTLKKIRLKSYLMSMSYDGKEVWGGDSSGMLHSFSMQSDNLGLVSDFDVGHTDLITGIHKSPGSLYTCSTDRTVKIHIPCAPPKTLCTMHYEAAVHRLSVQAGVLAVASGSENVEVWRSRR